MRSGGHGLVCKKGKYDVIGNIHVRIVKKGNSSISNWLSQVISDRSRRRFSGRNGLRKLKVDFIIAPIMLLQCQDMDYCLKAFTFYNKPALSS